MRVLVAWGAICKRQARVLELFCINVEGLVALTAFHLVMPARELVLGGIVLEPARWLPPAFGMAACTIRTELTPVNVLVTRRASRSQPQ